MFTEKKLRIAFVIICLSFLWSLLRLEVYRNKNQSINLQINELRKNVDSLQNLNDSLSSELYPCEIELSRHQVAFEIFMRRNPKAASQYGDIISDETE